MARAAPATKAAATGPGKESGALADPDVRHRRLALLDAPRARPLAAYVERLRAQGRGYVPDFDPLDGGTAARLLLVLEKPGPRTVPPAGSGFVSRDTDDPTARTIGRVMQQAGVPRRAVVIWNVVPWWNGTMAMTAAESAWAPRSSPSCRRCCRAARRHPGRQRRLGVRRASARPPATRSLRPPFQPGPRRPGQPRRLAAPAAYLAGRLGGGGIGARSDMLYRRCIIDPS